MVRRGAIVAVLALLLAGTSSYSRIPSVHVIGAPTTALPAPPERGTDRPPHLRLHITTQATSNARIILGAATTNKVVALTFDLDMNASMAAAARAGTVWINKDALAYLEARKIHATMFMTGMWAEAYPTLARELATNPN